MNERVSLVQGDITCIDAEIIVTAANKAMCGGGGVDGAVHDAAGPELVAASMALALCPSGQARITPAFNLDAKFVIHAVGPIFRSLEADAGTLGLAYESSLQLAANEKTESVAFPCISTGVYGFPQREACEIAINTVLDWLKDNEYPLRVVFCCYGDADMQLYQQRLDELGLL